MISIPDDVVERLAIEAAQGIASWRLGVFNQHLAAPMLPILRRAIRDAHEAMCADLRLRLPKDDGT